ncbi:hypothetical protein CSOJ01_01736 [Colletotrichum sojae]|uniref:Uncharacterized protein n=1 Tax=Colletotrichum sojae TaxID=2175907 RepID=A0A8H6JTJ6_9PEZI|nr:hypothetical protein CSOJ01_01736 [Colletotrichum sojae]
MSSNPGPLAGEEIVSLSSDSGSRMPIVYASNSTIPAACIPAEITSIGTALALALALAEAESLASLVLLRPSISHRLCVKGTLDTTSRRRGDAIGPTVRLKVASASGNEDEDQARPASCEFRSNRGLMPSSFFLSLFSNLSDMVFACGATWDPAPFPGVLAMVPWFRVPDIDQCGLE